MIITPLRISLSALLLCFACSSDGGSEAATTTISSAAGGTIEFEESQLVIPGNALEADTDITLRTGGTAEHAELAGAHDEVLNIEPADTVLSVPATLTLRLGDDAQQAMGGTAYHFTDGVWIPLTAVEISGGALEVTVSGFGAFAIVPPAVDGGGNVIRGTATWGDGSPVNGATVQLLVDQSPLTSTVTDAVGAYQFADLPVGTYTVLVEFECNFQETVAVSADTPTTLDIVICD